MGRKVWRKGKRGAKAWKGDTKQFKLTAYQAVLQSAPDGTVQSSSSYGYLSIGPIQNGVLTATKEFVGAFAFRFDQLIQASQMLSLFDRYKINGVRVKFLPRFNVAATPTNNGLPQIKLIHDYDDASVISNTASAWARLGKVYTLNKPVSVYVKPKTRSLVYGGVNGAGNMSFAYSSKSSGYVDMANQQIPHFGLKFAMRDVPANWSCRIETTFYVSLKNQMYPAAIDPIGPPKDREGEFEEDDTIEFGYNTNITSISCPTGEEGTV